MLKFLSLSKNYTSDFCDELEACEAIFDQKSLLCCKFCSKSGIGQNESNPSMVGPATNWLKLSCNLKQIV